MNRTVIYISLFVASFSLAQDNVLNLYIWSNYIDPTIIEDFEKEFSATVNQSFYENDDDMLAKVEATGGGLYDIVVPSSALVVIMKNKGLLEPLDPEKIPNLVNLGESFRAMDFDPDNGYSVPYGFGTMGILYNKTELGEITDQSWSILFDPAKQPGTFILLDSATELIGGALKYLGHSFNSDNVEELRAAYDVLEEAKTRAVGFDGSVGARNKVLAGQALLCVCYSLDAFGEAVDESGIELGYFVPKEGSEIFVDTMAIPAGAPNPDLAMEFLNFILRPDIAARNVNFLYIGSPNEAAKDLIDPEILSNPAIYPDEAAMSLLEPLEDVGNARQLRDELWNRLKAR
jgi:spermidine/putrescine transport system substrate-binding protein